MGALISWVRDGCPHFRMSFPITRGRKGPEPAESGVVPHKTYVVCLSCGKEIPYSWEQMRVLKQA